MRMSTPKNFSFALIFSFFVTATALHAAQLGDVTGDGEVDLLDAMVTLQVVSNQPVGPGNVSGSGDVNGDGMIGLEEALYAIQTAARLRNYPSLNPIGSKSVYVGYLLSFSISAADPEGDDLTFSALNLPTGANFQAPSRYFSWTPGSSQSGTYPVTFVVTDTNGYTDSETLTISVNELPRFNAPDYFPLQVGNWWDYIEEGTSEVSRTSVSGTKSIGGYTAYAVQYPEGEKEFYTSDSNGLRLFGVYVIDPDYTGDIFFDSPLLLAPNNAAIGSPDNVSSSSYPLTLYVPPYGYVTVTVDITAKTQILAMEDVTTENQRVLKDCIKASVQITQVMRETGETLESETTYYWFYKGVGVVKQTDSWSTLTIKASYVNGMLDDTY